MTLKQLAGSLGPKNSLIDLGTRRAADRPQRSRNFRSVSGPDAAGNPPSRTGSANHRPQIAHHKLTIITRVPCHSSQRGKQTFSHTGCYRGCFFPLGFRKFPPLAPDGSNLSRTFAPMASLFGRIYSGCWIKILLRGRSDGRCFLRVCRTPREPPLPREWIFTCMITHSHISVGVIVSGSSLRGFGLFLLDLMVRKPRHYPLVQCRPK